MLRADQDSIDHQGASVRATVNGVQQDVPRGTTLGAFLAHLGIRRDGTAVAVNASVVSRALLDTTEVETGDDIEIISAVAGG
jgi:sulfur carrier protein